jgi:hypothetical protein
MAFMLDTVFIARQIFSIFRTLPIFRFMSRVERMV